MSATGPAVGALDARPVRSLSPSRASDFATCPLLYRFRVVDRLPEPPSRAATRGTLVHSVLERLFDLPCGQRTLTAAQSLVAQQWQDLLASDPGLVVLFPDSAAGEAAGLEPDDAQHVVDLRDDPGADPGSLAAWLGSAEALLAGYFQLEDPTRLEPVGRELALSVELPSGLTLRGFVDRLDQAPDGALRVVDYKTGRAPGPGHEGRAMFQMRFYALALWHERGTVPRLLQLMYLANGVILRYEPDEVDLRNTQRKVEALWAAIERANLSGDWRPNPTRACDWCAHRDLCPAWGGTPPPLPAGAAASQAHPVTVSPAH